MSRGLIREDVTDSAGNALQGILVTIYQTGTLTKATIYSASEGGVVLANPVSTDADGEFSAYAATGEYDLKISAPGGDKWAYNVVAFDGDSVADLDAAVAAAQAAQASAEDTLIGITEESYEVGAGDTAVTVAEYTPGEGRRRYELESNRQHVGEHITETNSTTLTLASGPVGDATLYVTNYGNQAVATAAASNVSDSTRNQSAQVTLDQITPEMIGSESQFDTAHTNLKAAGGGDAEVSSGFTLTGAISIVGEFLRGVLFRGNRERITAPTDVSGLEVKNTVSDIGSEYFNKIRVEGVELYGPGSGVGSGSGFKQQAAAGVTVSDMRIREFPVGLHLDGALISSYYDVTTRDNGVGIKAVQFDDGAGGLQTLSPNDNLFVGAMVQSNDVAIQYDNHPNGSVTWIGCDIEGNNTGGTDADGVKVIELTNAGHQNFIGSHFESNPGQYGLWYDGDSANKTLLFLGTECIHNADTVVHVETGIFTGIASRVTNGGATNDLYLNTGAAATLIDTETNVSGDKEKVIGIRFGRVCFGGNPISTDPLIKANDDAISAVSGNIATEYSSDLTQHNWENAAGTRIGYQSFSNTADTVLHRDNAYGWRFDANNSTVAYIGRGGNSRIEPGADNTKELGTTALRWQRTYSTEFRPGSGAPIWTSGSGTPESSVTAPAGSMYTRTDGGAGTTLYIKESGSGNTGWIAK